VGRIGAARRADRARGGMLASLALWALRVLLAVVFAMAGLAKLGGDAAMVGMFAEIGLGQWLRYVVGALEVSGAVGVLIPRFSRLAAVGLVCLMIGATVTNMVVLGASPLLPVGLLAAGLIVAWGRRTDGGPGVERREGRSP